MKKSIFTTGLAVLVALAAAFYITGVISPAEAAAVAFVPALGMALTADRNTPSRAGEEVVLPAAAAKKFFAGSLVARDASGNATPGAVATTLLGAGRCAEYVDNSGGLAGDKSVRIEKGVFRFGNSAAADEITRAEIGTDCYIVDDQTVAKTNGTNTRSVAGKIFDVDADGVWVKFE